MKRIIEEKYQNACSKYSLDFDTSGLIVFFPGFQFAGQTVNQSNENSLLNLFSQILPSPCLSVN